MCRGEVSDLDDSSSQQILRGRPLSVTASYIDSRLVTSVRTCSPGAVDGWLSDLTRTYAIGKPTSAQRDNYKKLYEIRNVIEHTTVGRPVRELYEICQKGFEASGATLSMAHIGALDRRGAA